MILGELRDALCSTFCGDLTVREVPAGLAVSAMFEGADGDRLGCLIEKVAAGWRLSDDGAFLGDLEAYGVDVRKGGRADFLTRTLRMFGGRVDPITLQIVADLEEEPAPAQVLGFLSGLSRAQDVTFWTKERVRSTFKEDAARAIREVLGNTAEIEGAGAVDARLSEFPADLVIRPHGTEAGGTVTAVFLVQAIDALQEALLLALELRAQHRSDVRVAAMIEDGSLNMATTKAQRAVNRIDTVSYFRNDEREAAFRVARTAVPNLSSLAA